ncbi:ribosome silencing factor [Kitasatospora kifunensis]
MCWREILDKEIHVIDRKNTVTATERSQELITVAAQAAADKLAHNVIAFDVSDVLAITDAFLIASAANDRQVKAIAEEIEEKLREQLDVKPVRREGEREGRWILLDYLDIVVHVQHSEERSFYSLDRLWKDCPELPLPADALATRNRPEDAATDEVGNAVGFIQDFS